jgi:hypothetical protein
MDWQAAETGLKAWVVTMGGVAEHLVAWDRAPVGLRLYPQFDLRLFDHRARDGVGAEVVYPEPDVDGLVHPVVVAQRACSWSITCTSRDQGANSKAYVALDTLAVLLELPYSVDFFGGLGLSILDLGRVIPNSDVPRDHRDESMATLTLQLGYVTSATVPAAVDDGTSVIEHVEVGGTAMDVTRPIPIPPQIMPPYPMPSGQLLIGRRPLTIGGVSLVIAPGGTP